MKKIRKILVCLPVAVLLAGCFAAQEETPPETLPSVETVAVEFDGALPLAEAVTAARRNLLELQTVDSLRELAGEHAENRLLLALPDLMATPHDNRDDAPDRDIRLRTLDDAIAYNHLLSLGSGAMMPEARRPRAGELLDFNTAALLTRLAAEQQLLNLAASTTTRPIRSRIAANRIRDRIAELKLELRINTLFSDASFDRFDAETLAKPRKLTTAATALHAWAARHRSEAQKAELPAGFVEQFRSRGGLYRDGELKLAEFLLRLPQRLARLQLTGNGIDVAATARLANAIGAAFQLDLDLVRLERAYEAYRLPELKLKLDPDDADAAQQLIRTRGDWQLAWYRLLADLGGLAPTDELPELPPVPDSGPNESSEILLRLIGTPSN